MKKQEKGITLIALVVTIVVLLILAGISIGMLTGENGIIGQSKEAKESTEISQEKEIVNMAAVQAAGKDKYGNVTKNNLQDALDEIVGKGKTSVTGDRIFTVLFNESNREYKVNTSGEFVEPIDYANIYTYTEDGYITGIKKEYLKEEQGSLDKKYATIGDIKIAASHAYYYLVDELNEKLIIPNKIDNTNIIGIATEAFAYIDNVKQVIIADGIRELQDLCFFYCMELQRIDLPETLTYIGDGVFSSTNKLSCIRIPSSIQEIHPKAFDFSYLMLIIIDKEQGSLTNEPWESYAMILYTGDIDEQIEQFANDYLLNKTEQELEEIILKNEMYTGTFEELQLEKWNTKEYFKQEASNNNMTYTEYLKDIIKNDWWIQVEYKAYLMGISDKSTEEIEKIWMQKMGETGTFDEYWEEIMKMTRKEFEEMYTEMGFRTEKDFLIINILIME